MMTPVRQHPFFVQPLVANETKRAVMTDGQQEVTAPFDVFLFRPNQRRNHDVR